MIERLQRWYLSHPFPDRRAVLFWAGTVAALILIGIYAYVRLPSGMSVYYYLLGLFCLNSVIFFTLYQQLPAMKVTLLTLIVVLELAAFGYYILIGSSAVL